MAKKSLAQRARSLFSRGDRSTVALVPVHNAAPEPILPLPTSGAKKKVVKKIGLSFAPSQTTAFLGTGKNVTRLYEAPLFNLSEVRVACEADSFVRRSVNRHVDMFMKQGYRVDGNPKSVAYVRKRLAMMAAMTGKPMRTFISEAAADFIKYHNVFLIKGRLAQGEKFPATTTLKGISSDQPISAYFKVAPSTMSVARKRVGNEILMWLQTVGEFIPPQTSVSDQSVQKNIYGEPNRILIKPENMVHMYKDREEGEVFGTPFILPCIPDVKTLREVEQYVIELVYLFSNPIVEWRVGSEQTPGEESDIEDARREAENGPVSGIYVIPGDQSIKVHGAASGVDAIDYLEYFEKRVFTGLGTNQTSMGRGDTSNRSTARSMEDEFMDRIRGYHREFEAFFNELIINELLMEAGINPFDEEQAAYIQFNDPDTNLKGITENQEIQKFTNFLTTRTEARSAMGYDPLPEGENKDTFMNLIKVPLAIIQAVDEPYTDAAKAALKTAGAPTSVQKNPPPAAGAQTKPGGGSPSTKSPDNKTQPKNQHGTGTRKPAGSREGADEWEVDDVPMNIKTVFRKIMGLIRNINGDYADGEYMSDEIGAVEKMSKYLFDREFGSVLRLYRALEADIVNVVNDRFGKDADNFSYGESGIIFTVFVDTVVDVERTSIQDQYYKGMRQCLSDLNSNSIDMERMAARLEALIESNQNDWTKMTRIIRERLSSTLAEAKTKAEAISLAHGVFETLNYLVKAKAKTHFYHAKNFGYGYTAYVLGERVLVVQVFEGCEQCREHAGQVELDGFSVHTLPPFHYNCECEVRIKS